jgi:uncharacterized metal-binding protein YceD (DUF177 family)
MNATRKSESCFVYEIDVERLPDSGLIDHLSANEEERAAVAAELGLLSIAGLAADITIQPWRKQGIKVAGAVVATIEQTCVVSLDPFTSRLEAPFERYYLRGNLPGHTGTVVTIDPLDEDEPEALETNKIDLGQVIVETLSLALDPYPRKPGAKFTWQDAAEGQDDGRDNPFAVLKRLKGNN